MSTPIRDPQSAIPNPIITLIAAMSRNRVIGRDNQLPWRLPADLKRFKSLTMNHAVIMGRKTFDSIGRKPLPGRTNIVITRDRSASFDGAVIGHSLAQALQLANEHDQRTHHQHCVFILGGSEIFREAMPLAHRIELTLVDAEIDGDAHFPEIDRASWKLVHDEPHPADEKHSFPYRFQTFERADSDR